jgi:hypothetical protein
VTEGAGAAVWLQHGLARLFELKEKRSPPPDMSSRIPHIVPTLPTPTTLMA